MEIKVSIDLNNDSDINVDVQLTKNKNLQKNIRNHKGKSLLIFPDDYVVLDLETTGLDSKIDSIIEIAMLRISHGEEIGQFHTLVNPHCPICDFISELTGITNEELSLAPDISDILPKALEFIGDSIIVAHNANFDINFIYDNCIQLQLPPFSNNFIDTMRISRKVFPELPHHRLSDLVDFFGLSGDAFHRANTDIIYTQQCYELMKQYCIGNGIPIQSSNDLWTILSERPKISNIVSQKDTFDTSHPLYNQYVVFTGVLEKMTRQEAAKIVADLGGHNCDNVTKRTNFLVLGNNDYCSKIKDGKSNKQKKAEKYQLEGLPIQIISENVFYDMIMEE